MAKSKMQQTKKKTRERRVAQEKLAKIRELKTTDSLKDARPTLSRTAKIMSAAIVPGPSSLITEKSHFAPSGKRS
ncbi:hypothetical protein [Planctomicrobium piriforme]|uniref:Uncharacterized protein n=1 Tax=Planctomicrobium piriforme TaxID=1576369 RepID=A0A1I3IPD8_9PLAN|nr:hypothetical protein [Planctomicrobium piriforme]SFI49831.1 hypothetical protein SAMN05421753_109204 [Planctomicrobium piriforme]